MKLTDDNAIDIRYEAETDKPTIVDMANHSILISMVMQQAMQTAY